MPPKKTRQQIPSASSTSASSLRSSASAKAARGQRILELMLGLALAAVTLLVYSPSLDHPFVDYDDRYYVVQNEHVHEGLTTDGIRYAFTTYDCANWHPLTWLSLELDADLYGGLRAGGFHLTNVVLHIANTLLLFFVLGRMTGMVWRSAAVAALFAWHPLHVESVAWVAERKDVLSTFFWMLTLAAYLFYVRRPGVHRYLLVMLALGLGLLAKPMVVTLPCVLLLLDYWPLGRWRHGSPATGPDVVSPAASSWQRLLLEKLPLFALVAVACVLTVVAQRHSRAVMSFERFPLEARLANALVSYVAYLGKTFWPTHLAALYPHIGSTISVVQSLACGLFLAAVTVVVLVAGRRWPYLAVGWLWYVGTLVPVIGVVQVGMQGMADRYTYVPLIGIFLLVIWGVTDVARTWGLPRYGVAVVAGAALAYCVGLTWFQLAHWSSEFALWSHAVEVTENNAGAHAGLGIYYYEKHADSHAAQEFQKALAIDPGHVVATMNYGNVLLAQGRPREALTQYRRAVELTPDYPTARNYLGDALLAVGRQEEARAEYQVLLVLEPNSALAHQKLGIVYARQGRQEEALAEYHKAVELEPKNASDQLSLGEALLELGRYDEAEASSRRAVELVASDHPLHNVATWQVERCRRQKALEQALPDVLAGKTQPATAEERLETASLLEQPRWRRYAASARLYAAAFALEPQLADEPRQNFRYNAACAAALAGAGQGHESEKLDEQAKAALRAQALDWLRTDAALWRKRITSKASDLTLLRLARQAQRDGRLAGVRDPAALAELPEAERAAWAELWEQVGEMLASAP